MRRLGVLALTTLTLGGALVGVAQPAAAAGTNDPVLYWNGVLLDTYRHVGGAPGPLARSGAMMHAAIYDAVNSITTIGQPYVFKTDAPGASTKHAIAYAAHDTLASTFPTLDFADELAGALNGAGGTPATAPPSARPPRPRSSAPASTTARRTPRRTCRTRSPATGGRPDRATR